MKLYYSSGSCSTSCHITLEESGLPYEAIQVDWDSPTGANAELVSRLNPVGTLPVMTLPGEQVLTQNISIHTYIADQVPEKKLLPKAGTLERAQALNWLSFVAADLHKSFAPLFGIDSITPDPAGQARIREWGVRGVTSHLAHLDRSIAGKDFLNGKDFTVADAYCFVVCGWAPYLKIPTADFQNLNAYLKRVSERPAAQRVLKAEGLLK